jgi:hypothetical protein
VLSVVVLRYCCAAVYSVFLYRSAKASNFFLNRSRTRCVYKTGNKAVHTGYDLFTVVFMKCSVFWDITLCLLKVSQRFWVTCCLLANFHMLSCWFHALLVLQPCWWRQHVLPICWLALSEWQGWFLKMPSIATKFQYINSPFIFLLTTCFGPSGPSSGEIYN